MARAGLRRGFGHPPMPSSAALLSVDPVSVNPSVCPRPKGEVHADPYGESPCADRRSGPLGDVLPD